MVVRKMKEKCKDAARMRREKERAEFIELSKLLPLPASTTSQLDKASVIRLTSSYLRMRSAFPEGLGVDWGTRRNTVRYSSSNHHNGLAVSAHAIGQSGERTNQPSSSIVHQPQTREQNIRELGSLILQTLDGFVFALHRDGKIMYISETASVLLGLPQIDLTGSSIFEYVHPADHNDIQEVLNLSNADKCQLSSSSSTNSRSAQCDLEGEQHRAQASMESSSESIELGRSSFELSRSFCIRMRCILPKRNAGLVSNGFKAIHCSGYLKARHVPLSLKTQQTPRGNTGTTNQASRHNALQHQQQQHPQSKQRQAHQQRLQVGMESMNVWESCALVAVGHSLLPTASTEVRLGTNTFMFRANLDLRLYYIETNLSSRLGYSHGDLVGKSLYQFVHVADLDNVELTHRQILDKGQSISRYFRLMRRDGGHIWIQTNGTLINNPKSMPKPQHIVGICCVISEDAADQSRSLLIEQETWSNQQFKLTTGANKTTFPCKTFQSKRVKLQADSLTSDFSKMVQRGQDKGQAARKIRAKFSAVQQLASGPVVECRPLAPMNELSDSYSLEVYDRVGSLRRKSDDTCSIVSSIASTSASSLSSPAFSSLSYNSAPGNSLMYASSSASSTSSSTSSESNLHTMDTTLGCPFSANKQCYTHSTAIVDVAGFSSGIRMFPSYPTKVEDSTDEHWPRVQTQQQSQLDSSNGLLETGQIVEQPATFWSQTIATSSAASLSTLSLALTTMSPSQIQTNNTIAPIVAHQNQTHYSDTNANQYYHRTGDEQPDIGYYYDNCVSTYQSESLPVYMNSKEGRITSFGHGGDSSSQYTYQIA